MKVPFSAIKSLLKQNRVHSVLNLSYERFLDKEGRYKASGLNPKKFQKQRVASSIRKMQTIRG